MSSAALDVDVGSVVLGLAGTAWPTAQAHVSDSITGGTITRTMDGASTLTLQVEDAQRALLRSGIFSDQVDLPYGGQWWRLVQVTKSGDQLNLTFEDRVVSLLRAKTRPRKASRSKMTRAEFVLSLVQELKPPPVFVCPELHVTQPVAAAAPTTSTSKKEATAPGFATGANLTVKGSPATPEQIQNCALALSVAAGLKADARVQTALVEAMIVESTITNPSGTSADGYGSRGILQVRDVTGKSMGITNTDIAQCVDAFLTRGFTGAGGAITYAAKNPSITTGQIAQAMEGSGYPGRYDLYHTEAARWVAQYSGAAATGATVDTRQVTKAQPFQFQRGGTSGDGKNSWETMTKLAQDVKWHCFVLDGAVWFVSDKALIGSAPVADLSEDTLGIDTIDFDVDNGKTKNEATVTCRASRWAFAPGSVVAVHDCGPADGRWLVQTYSRGLFDPVATVTLRRETLPLPEPAATTTTTSGASTSFGPAGPVPSFAHGAGEVASVKVSKAWEAAQMMDAKRYPYIWGGGHAHCGTPDHGLYGTSDSAGQHPVAEPGYDCSGSTCGVLAAAGMGFALGQAAVSSGPIAAGWGEAGEGAGLTVWANSVHVWMEFKPSSGPAKHFGTGAWGIDNPGGGPRFQMTMHTKDGFTPRHWPGT